MHFKVMLSKYVRSRMGKKGVGRMEGGKEERKKGGRETIATYICVPSIWIEGAVESRVQSYPKLYSKLEGDINYLRYYPKYGEEKRGGLEGSSVVRCTYCSHRGYERPHQETQNCL